MQGWETTGTAHALTVCVDSMCLTACLANDALHQAVTSTPWQMHPAICHPGPQSGVRPVHGYSCGIWLAAMLLCNLVAC